jgi:multiple sugar transport system permease protein
MAAGERDGRMRPAKGSGMALIADVTGKNASSQSRTSQRGSRMRLLSVADKAFLAVLIGVPLLALLAFVWLPALASVGISFTQWDGIGLSGLHWVGLQNYKNVFTNYPPFWPAVEHNIIWRVFTALVPTPAGIFLAYQLDRKIRFSRVYQMAIFLPVVLSTAVVGFIWEIVYDPDHGLLNSALGTNNPSGKHYIDWLGDPHLNLWAVLVASAWRHTGYDMVYVLSGNNGSKQGLELLSLLITNNTVGESPRPGYGSALATVLLVVSMAAIVTFLVQNFRKERQA